jgi:hypothetical protein
MLINKLKKLFSLLKVKRKMSFREIEDIAETWLSIVPDLSKKGYEINVENQFIEIDFPEYEVDRLLEIIQTILEKDSRVKKVSALWHEGNQKFQSNNITLHFNFFSFDHDYEVDIYKNFKHISYSSRYGGRENNIFSSCVGTFHKYWK